ncbi:MAG: MDR family oxidoreductase [Acidimicrobiales bacterium]|jgi:acrylyl-CoA reductase (NADPH)
MSAVRAVLAAEPGGPAGRLTTIEEADLPEGDVTIRVTWSSLNYKDGLAVTGKGKVVRSFPMVCGVDLAGVVQSSESPRFSPGDQVLVTGFGLGEERFGGFAELARVRSEWVVPMPDGLDARRSMIIGTAGLTSMLCVMALEHNGLTPDGSGGLPVVVTGAAGGVGSVAVALLAGLGYDVAAVSGRSEQEAYLRRLGASSLVPRSELADAPPRPLDKERWAGAVDAVGGSTLGALLRQTRYGGCVAACGLAGGTDLPTTVHPFILRGVTLAGVESVRCPIGVRHVAWRRLAHELPGDLLDEMAEEATLDDVPALAEEILAGRTRGRVVISVQA